MRTRTKPRTMIEELKERLLKTMPAVSAVSPFDSDLPAIREIAQAASFDVLEPCASSSALSRARAVNRTGPGTRSRPWSKLASHIAQSGLAIPLSRLLSTTPNDTAVDAATSVMPRPGNGGHPIARYPASDSGPAREIEALLRHPAAPASAAAILRRNGGIERDDNGPPYCRNSH